MVKKYNYKTTLSLISDPPSIRLKVYGVQIQSRGVEEKRRTEEVYSLVMVSILMTPPFEVLIDTRLAFLRGSPPYNELSEADQSSVL